MIIYRDCLRGPPRTPSWLEGAADLCRRASPTGDLVAVCDPLFLDERPGQTWADLGDGWSACLDGALELPSLMRHDWPGGRLPVEDAAGRTWLLPAVLDPAGAPAIPGRLLRGPDGSWERRFSPAQQRAIDSLRLAREEISAGRFAQIPLAAGVEWAAAAIELTYHLNVATCAALGLLDDRLVQLALLGCSGTPLEGD